MRLYLVPISVGLHTTDCLLSDTTRPIFKHEAGSRASKRHNPKPQRPDKQTAKQSKLTTPRLTILLALLLSACTTGQVFVYEDVRGISQFTIYHRSNFQYEERTARSYFQIRGQCDIRDTIVRFTYPRYAPLPFCYPANPCTRHHQSADTSLFSLQLLEGGSRDPMLFSGIILRDSLGGILATEETDLFGSAVFGNRADAAWVEIYTGLAPTLFVEYEELRGYHSTCLIPNVPFGGRQSNTCLIEFLDVVLPYHIDADHQTLTHDGVVYQRTKNRLLHNTPTKQTPTPRRLSSQVNLTPNQ